MMRFIQIGNKIFQLEQVASAAYHKLSEEDARHFGMSVVQVELKMTDGNVLVFRNNEAEQVWGALKACALNITPREQSADEEG